MEVWRWKADGEDVVDVIGPGFDGSCAAGGEEGEGRDLLFHLQWEEPPALHLGAPGALGALGALGAAAWMMQRMGPARTSA